MLDAITIDKLAQIFFISHRVKIILKITVNFVSCETFSYAILILIFIDISTFPYFCKKLQDVFRNIFVPKKINTVARQTIVLYYFLEYQPELASIRFNYCAATQRLHI